LPWALIKLYYAAFYAGHAVARLFGESCSFFAAAHIRRISEFASALQKPTPFPLTAGLYRCAISANGSGLRCVQVRGSVGGAHESFWDVFGNTIKSLGVAVLSSPLERQEAQTVYTKIDLYHEMMQPQRRYSWLSGMRNDVQYRYQYGVWFPPENKKQERLALARLAAQWVADPMTLTMARGGTDLDEFVMTCVFTIAMCRTMILRVAQRSGSSSRHFTEYGPMSLLRQMKAT
jgi:hypothetical protein